MNILILGATGGTGRALTAKLLEAGHQVTAFARNPWPLVPAANLTICTGNALVAEDVGRTVPGHDAVVITLGNSQNPFAMMVGARRTTAANICEQGTRHVISAMLAHAITRIVVVSAFGVGDTKAKADFMTRAFLSLVLREHMADKEKQEALVKASTLDWTLVHPVALVDTPVLGRWSASVEGTVGKPMISRADLSSYIADELSENRHIRRTVTLSS
jgi:uncharacterized protein YbjT (DUF2867 family)